MSVAVTSPATPITLAAANGVHFVTSDDIDKDDDTASFVESKECADANGGAASALSTPTPMASTATLAGKSSSSIVASVESVASSSSVSRAEEETASDLAQVQSTQESGVDKAAETPTPRVSSLPEVDTDTPRALSSSDGAGDPPQSGDASSPSLDRNELDSLNPYRKTYAARTSIPPALASTPEASSSDLEPSTDATPSPRTTLLSGRKPPVPADQTASSSSTTPPSAPARTGAAASSRVLRVSISISTPSSPPSPTSSPSLTSAPYGPNENLFGLSMNHMELSVEEHWHGIGVIPGASVKKRRSSRSRSQSSYSSDSEAIHFRRRPKRPSVLSKPEDLKVRKKVVPLPFTPTNPANVKSTFRRSNTSISGDGGGRDARHALHTRSRSMPSLLQRELFVNAPTWRSLVNQGFDDEEKANATSSTSSSSASTAKRTIERTRSATSIITSSPGSKASAANSPNARPRSVSYAAPSYELDTKPSNTHSPPSEKRHARTRSLDTRASAAYSRPITALDIPDIEEEIKESPEASSNPLSPTTGVAREGPSVHTPIVKSEIDARRSVRSLKLGFAVSKSPPSTSSPLNAESSASSSSRIVSSDIRLPEETAPNAENVPSKPESNDATSPPLPAVSPDNVNSTSSTSTHRVSSTADSPSKDDPSQSTKSAGENTHTAASAASPNSQVQTLKSAEKMSAPNSLAKADTASALLKSSHSRQRRTTGTLENGVTPNGHSGGKTSYAVEDAGASPLRNGVPTDTMESEFVQRLMNGASKQSEAPIVSLKNKSPLSRPLSPSYEHRPATNNGTPLDTPSSLRLSKSSRSRNTYSFDIAGAPAAAGTLHNGEGPAGEAVSSTNGNPSQSAGDADGYLAVGNNTMHSRTNTADSLPDSPQYRPAALPPHRPVLHHSRSAPNPSHLDGSRSGPGTGNAGSVASSPTPPKISRRRFASLERGSTVIVQSFKDTDYIQSMINHRRSMHALNERQRTVSFGKSQFSFIASRATLAKSQSKLSIKIPSPKLKPRNPSFADGSPRGTMSMGSLSSLGSPLASSGSFKKRSTYNDYVGHAPDKQALDTISNSQSMSDQDFENLMNHPKLHYMTDMSHSDVAKLRANRKLAKQLGCIPVTVKEPGADASMSPYAMNFSSSSSSLLANTTSPSQKILSQKLLASPRRQFKNSEYSSPSQSSPVDAPAVAADDMLPQRSPRPQSSDDHEDVGESFRLPSSSSRAAAGAAGAADDNGTAATAELSSNSRTRTSSSTSAAATTTTSSGRGGGAGGCLRSCLKSSRITPEQMRVNMMFERRKEHAKKYTPIMKKGAVMCKVSQGGGQLHRRFFSLSADESDICWSKSQNGRRKKRISLFDVVEVVLGKQFPTVFGDNQAPNAPPEWMCFTLVCPNHVYLHVCALDVATFMAFFLGIQSLTTFTHNDMTRGRVLWHRALWKLQRIITHNVPTKEGWWRYDGQPQQQPPRLEQQPPAGDGDGAAAVVPTAAPVRRTTLRRSRKKR